MSTNKLWLVINGHPPLCSLQTTTRGAEYVHEEDQPPQVLYLIHDRVGGQLVDWAQCGMPSCVLIFCAVFGSVSDVSASTQPMNQISVNNVVSKTVVTLDLAL